MEIHSHTGRHVVMEIWTGGKHAKVQGWRCLKCEQVFEQPWNQAPALSGCPKADTVIDMAPLHRSPARQDDPKVFVPAQSLGTEFRLPLFLLAVSDDKGTWSPVLFHPTAPGFVLTRDPAETQKTFRLLEWAGLKVGPGMEISVIPVPDEATFKKLPALAARCDKPVTGVYTSLARLPRGLEYRYMPFGSNS